ncbi:MAG: 30S ribosomal protein S6 [Ignavibacteriaceae bacterium]|nr:30S ribosomal protein S6 [Ignavibacteriaceae bacterium]
MKTNAYESTVMINAALDDDQIEVEVSRLQENIINFGGEIIEVDKVGRKRLAYIVNKSKIGYYAIFRFNAPSNIISKLERFYTLDDNILRFLTIALDKDALEYFEKNKAAALDLIPDVLTPAAPDEIIIDVKP